MSALGDATFVLARGVMDRARGLLGTRAGWGAGHDVLVLLPCRSVHTVGMRYALDVAFCDAGGTVVRSETDVRPGRLLSCGRAAFVLERPHADDGTWPVEGDVVPLRLHRRGNGRKGRCDFDGSCV